MRSEADYQSSLALLDYNPPYNYPLDPVARARVQLLRTDTRKWIREQKALASAWELSPMQAFFVSQIPDNWREIESGRRRRSRLE